MSVVTKSRVVPSSSRMLGALRYSCGHSFAKIPPHARLQRELRPVLRSSGSDAVTSDEDAFFPEPCAPAFVMVDQGHPHFTQISIDVTDYPGLLRVITWVLNGLGCRAQNAVLKTTEDGQAQDTFWITDLRGRKLPDGVAEDLASRLEDFVSYCAPPTIEGEFTEFRCGDIFISNVAHPVWTAVTITAELFSPGLLLELSSIFYGQGLSIAEAVVRGGSESPIPPDMCSDPSAIPDPPPGKRMMRFWLRDTRTGSKLEFADVTALVYTLRVVLGDGNIPTRPPNSELSTLECGEDGNGGSSSSSGGLRSGSGATIGSDSDEAADKPRPVRGKVSIG